MSVAVPPLLVIAGQTASGKSALAIKLARRLNGEIICADSWTVRREVNLGTAKPSAAERAAVRHHLLDEVPACQDFTAAVFKRLAERAIDDIAGRGKLPIMVGGSGLYVDGVLYDYGFLAEGDRAARAELNRLTADELLNRVKAAGLDPAGLDVRNKRRLIRLLETGGARPTRRPLRPNSLIIGLQVPSEELKLRIIRRVDGMIANGLEKEVRDLVGRYGWDCEALKGVGYAQWREYIDGTADLAETRQRIIRATNELAKRQRTWFKRNKSIHWLDYQIETDEVVDLVTTYFAGK